MTTVARDARTALAAKAAAEQDLARLSLCPPWRHAAFAAVMAALVAIPAVSSWMRFALLAIVFGAIAMIVRSDRRRLGVFVNGYRRGRTRLVTFPMLVLVMALYGISIYYGLDRDRPAISLLCAAAAFVVGYVGSILWQRVFVRELRG